MSRESDKWNDYLTDLSRKLSSYEIQKDKKKYNVADIEHWGKSGHEQGIEITRDNFESFIKKTARYDITGHEYVKGMAITESQLSELNEILRIALKLKPNRSCSTMPKELVIKGDYVKFSDFIGKDGHLDRSDGCMFINTIKIYVLNTLFVDQDINETIDIVVVSPKWEIVNTRVVNISGFNDTLSDPDYWIELEESAYGGDGKPGLPGIHGGHFLGIGAKYVNGENLNIITDGGNGGAGADGKPGYDGMNGFFSLVLDSRVPCKRDWCINGSPRITHKGYSRYGCKRISYVEESHSWSSTTHSCEYRIPGYPGTSGSSGGHGGMGGMGGSPGEIVLYELNGTSGISKHREVGNVGKNGTGGEGGEGGVNGHDVILKFTEENGWRIIKSYSSDLRGEKGQNGIDGANRRGMYHPYYVIPPSPKKILREYKNYLRENLNYRSKRHALMEFLHQLDNDNAVVRIYNRYELDKELKDLEEQFPIFNDGVDLTEVYQLYLNRVRRYAMIPRPKPFSGSNKKLLICLDTAALGKIFYFNDLSDSNLMMNIDEYLDKTMSEIQGVRDLQKTAARADLINSYTENYKKYIDRQIEEAVYTIEQRTTPIIDNVSAQIDKEIDRLISETATLENLAENDESELIEKRNELKRAMELGKLCNNLKTIEEILSFFGPVGLSVKSLIGSSAPANSSVIDNQTDYRNILRSRVNSYDSQIVTDKVKEIVNLRELLDDIAVMINVHPDKFNDVSNKIGDMKKRLSNGNSLELHQVLMMENELRDELRKKYLNLSDSTKKENDDGQPMDVKAVMDNINKAVELYAVSRDLYHKFKNDEVKVNAISAARKGEENQQLDDNQKNIYDAMIWMLQNRDKKLRGISINLYQDDMNKISLDVKSWQVPSFLEDVKSNVTRMTGTFENMDDDLSNCVKLLQDTMTCMINAYSKIQDYQKEQKFINFSADVAGNLAMNSTPYTSPTFLDTLLRSNYVMIRRKMMSTAMKNFVFPFAQEFLSDSVILTDSRPLKNDLEELLSNVTEQIESSKSKIDIYRTYLNGTGHNVNIELGKFTSGNTSTEPFFIWKNSQNRDAITKLLSGQSVNVTANINQSPAQKDAIKFSVAEFFFNARNDTIQKEVNNVLKGFEIRARHLGDSHYRCENKIYRMNSPVTSITYYLEKGADGESVNKSLSYVDLKQSKPILSPYAKWEVTLMGTGKTVAFGDLEKYKDVVDLELIGSGSYIDNRKDVYSSLSIDSHYRKIEIPNESVREPETSGKTSNRRNIRSADAPKNHREKIDAPLELPSPVKCITDCFIETTKKFMNLSVIGTIKNWFQNRSIEDDEEISKQTGYPYDDPFDIDRKSAHIELPSLNIDHSSNRFIDNENHSSSMIENNLPITQGHLLLIDTFLRKKNGSVYKIAKNESRDLSNTEHAQHLAYNAHVPKDESSMNAKSSMNP